MKQQEVRVTVYHACLPNTLALVSRRLDAERLPRCCPAASFALGARKRRGSSVRSILPS
jgi:hypothetical protein